MKKDYEVTLIATCTVWVEAASNADEAMEWACDRVSRGDFNIDDLKAAELSAVESESSKRHADVRSESDD